MIFEHTPADEFCESPLSVKANGRTITCGSIVLATHTPLMGRAGPQEIRAGLWDYIRENKDYPYYK